MRSSTRWLPGSALLAAAIYVLLWVAWAHRWSWVAGLDTPVLTGAHDFAAGHPGWVTGWDVFCTVLGPGAFRLVGAVVIVAALWRRRIRTAVFLLVTVEGSALVTELAKAFADRPRPATALVDAWGTAFPSGHALGVLVAVAAYLTVARPALTARARLGWAVTGAAVVVTIGVGRVLLNVHHPTDVLAGWALGYAYFVGCRLALPLMPAAGTPAAPDNST